MELSSFQQPDINIDDLSHLSIVFGFLFFSFGLYDISILHADGCMVSFKASNHYLSRSWAVLQIWKKRGLRLVNCIFLSINIVPHLQFGEKSFFVCGSGQHSGCRMYGRN